MKILYIYAHPNNNALNALLKQEGYKQLIDLKNDVTFSNLYELGFNAIANSTNYKLTTADELTKDIQIEMEKIAWADHLIFQFPLWWFSTPAILKGWFDRVFIKGFAYDNNHLFETGLLKGKTASLIVTTKSTESAYQLDGAHGATIDNFLLPIHHTLRFAGISPIKPFVAYGIFDLNKQRIDEIILQYQDYLHHLLDQRVNVGKEPKDPN